MNKAKVDAETSWQNNWDRVRQARNHLLLDTDWTVMSDSPLSNDKKQEYITYRRILEIFHRLTLLIMQKILSLGMDMYLSVVLKNYKADIGE